MRFVTVAEMTIIRDKAVVAYTNALSGKSLTFTEDGVTRSNTRQEIATLLAAVQYWDKEIERKTSGRRGIDTRFITPVM